MSPRNGLLALGFTGALVFAPSIVFAATDMEIAEALLQETASQLEIVIEDPALSESLAEDLEYAIVEDVINPEIVDEIDQAIEDGGDLDLEENVDDNLDEQEELWRDKAPELLTAFEQVKVEFQQCREASPGPANQCARGLGFRLQVASTQIALENLETLRQSLDSLSGTELEEAQALIAEQERQLAAKIQRAEEKLARVGTTTAEAGELEAVVRTVRNSGISSVASPGSKNGSSRGQSPRSAEDTANTSEQPSGESSTEQPSEEQPANNNSDSESGNNNRGNSGNSGQGGNDGNNGKSGENKGRGNG